MVMCRPSYNRMQAYIDYVLSFRIVSLASLSYSLILAAGYGVHLLHS